MAKLHDGSLEAEANRLTVISGHGRLKRRDGTIVDIGGSTGGFARAFLYNWTPPNLDGVVQRTEITGLRFSAHPFELALLWARDFV